MHLTPGKSCTLYLLNQARLFLTVLVNVDKKLQWLTVGPVRDDDGVSNRGGSENIFLRGIEQIFEKHLNNFKF